MAVSKLRRLLFGNHPGDKLDDTPVELPAGKRVGPSMAREIQEQIAIQIALKQGPREAQTIGEIEAELEELEREEYEEKGFPQFEYLEMADEYEPEPFHSPEADDGAPQDEGVTSDEAKKDE